jgi:AcrR family transcriptional regulator
MRADAKKNYDHLLTVARDVLTEQGADASLRDIARRAEVGLGTLYRHFPTREALLEAILHERFGALTARAVALEGAGSGAADHALVTWLREAIAGTRQLHGLTAVMMGAIEDHASALHVSCVALRSAGTRLLARAQADGLARADIDGTDLFALVAALAWLGDQPALSDRTDHLFAVIQSAILTPSTSASTSAG